MDTAAETALVLEAEADVLSQVALRLRERAQRIRRESGWGPRLVSADGEARQGRPSTPARSNMSPRIEVRLARARERARQQAASLYAILERDED